MSLLQQRGGKKGEGAGLSPPPRHIFLLRRGKASHLTRSDLMSPRNLWGPAAGALDRGALSTRQTRPPFHPPIPPTPLRAATPRTPRSPPVLLLMTVMAAANNSHTYTSSPCSTPRPLTSPTPLPHSTPCLANHEKTTSLRGRGGAGIPVGLDHGTGKTKDGRGG